MEGIKRSVINSPQKKYGEKEGDGEATITTLVSTRTVGRINTKGGGRRGGGKRDSAKRKKGRIKISQNSKTKEMHSERG